MSAPLQPIIYTEFDQNAQFSSASILEMAGAITSIANWALGVLTTANRDAGLLLGPDQTQQPGGGYVTGYAPMSDEMLAHYQDIFGKLRYVGDLLTKEQGGTMAAIEIVRPWSRAGSQTAGFAQPPPSVMAGMRRF